MSDYGIKRVLVPTKDERCLPRPEPNRHVPVRLGYDNTYLRIRDKLATRGISCLAIDTPGVCEALCIGKIYTRYDYEVPVGAAIQPRAATSLVTVSALSAAAWADIMWHARPPFEQRLRAVVAWGANYDYPRGLAPQGHCRRCGPDVSTDVHHRHRRHGCGDEARREIFQVDRSWYEVEVPKSKHQVH